MLTAQSSQMIRRITFKCHKNKQEKSRAWRIRIFGKINSKRWKLSTKRDEFHALKLPYFSRSASQRHDLHWLYQWRQTYNQIAHDQATSRSNTGYRNPYHIRNPSACRMAPSRYPSSDAAPWDLSAGHGAAGMDSC